MATATISSKGQVTLPEIVRRKLRLKAGDRLEFLFDSGGNVVLKARRRPFEDLLGILHQPDTKPASVREMDSAIRATVRDRWKRGRKNGPNGRS